MGGIFSRTSKKKSRGHGGRYTEKDDEKRSKGETYEFDNSTHKPRRALRRGGKKVMEVFYHVKWIFLRGLQGYIFEKVVEVKPSPSKLAGRCMQGTGSKKKQEKNKPCVHEKSSELSVGG